MRRAALLLALLAAPGLALAGTVTVSWVHPTKYTDGTALALEDITGTRCLLSQAQTLASPVVANAAAPASSLRVELADGQWFVACATLAKGGGESILSPVVAFVVAPLRPNPPQAVNLQ